jgi:hypothetical protein
MYATPRMSTALLAIRGDMQILGMSEEGDQWRPSIWCFMQIEINC